MGKALNFTETIGRSLKANPLTAGMLLAIRLLLPRIIIGVSFYILGFFVVAGALDLTARDIVSGLIAGAVGGLTILLVVLDRSVELRHDVRARLDAS